MLVKLWLPRSNNIALRSQFSKASSGSIGRFIGNCTCKSDVARRRLSSGRICQRLTGYRCVTTRKKRVAARSTISFYFRRGNTEVTRSDKHGRLVRPDKKGYPDNRACPDNNIHTPILGESEYISHVICIHIFYLTAAPKSRAEIARRNQARIDALNAIASKANRPTSRVAGAFIYSRSTKREIKLGPRRREAAPDRLFR